ncbi:MAG: sel1 repeat family protein [Verrucomicrobiales bacterium]|nr:sel1 repeat family protein [Verrucomicrobiales bacterium]
MNAFRFLPLLLLAAAVAPAGAQSQGTPLPGLQDALPPAGETPKLPPTLRAAAEAANKGDLAAAAELLKTEAAKGNADAALGYAEFLLTGKGVKADASAAITWLEKAGTPAAQLLESDIFRVGAPGVPKDADRAAFLLNAAAEAGDPNAQTRLGAGLEQQAMKGDAASERDRFFREAREWYEKAAAKAQPDALFALAKFTRDGIAGYEKNEEKATAGFFKAAAAGSYAAGNEMGIRYRAGLGIHADSVAGVGWFLAAAESGHPPAMINLGRCYETAEGVPRNYDRAGFWYARAAKAGLPEAQFFLGGLFENGLGTAKNTVFAFVNYSRAANAGFKDAAVARDRLKPGLSPQQLAEADKLLIGEDSKP